MTADCMNDTQSARTEAADILACTLLDAILSGKGPGDERAHALEISNPRFQDAKEQTKGKR